MNYQKVIERLGMALTELKNLEFLYDIGDLCGEDTKDELNALNIRLDFFQEKIQVLENQVK